MRISGPPKGVKLLARPSSIKQYKYSLRPYFLYSSPLFFYLYLCLSLSGLSISLSLPVSLIFQGSSHRPPSVSTPEAGYYILCLLPPKERANSRLNPPRPGTERYEAAADRQTRPESPLLTPFFAPGKGS